MLGLASRGIGELKVVHDYARKPTRGERVLGISLSAMLVLLFGALSVISSLHGLWTAAIATSALLAAAVVLLYRATFGRRRALHRNASRRLAWALLVLGAGGFAIVLCIQGSIVHRLMLLGGSMTLFSSGLAGVRRPRDRA